jgi:UDP-4-amino-4,6-dideoxy-N-acetyl-beta-L-altrosamine N-acetyltransferase
MIISEYGINLQKIDKSNLEMIRSWRNSEFVKKYMVFQDQITSEMQQKWFHNIDNVNNYYFLIIQDHEAIGLANIKDINYDLKTGESGIFMKSEDYTNSDSGVKATLALLDFAFIELNLARLYQTITKANKAAQNFNKHLGVTITKIQDGVSHGYLDKETYLLRNDKIRNFLNR